jgi:ABC-type multidrug transport system ATPase subunit
MQITKVTTSNTTASGLKPVKMTKLGSVVLLAGKNGSGKSRLINLLQKLSNETISGFSFTRGSINQQLRQVILPRLSRLTNYTPTLPLHLDNAVRKEFMTAYHPSTVNFDWSLLEEIEFNSEELPKLIHFVPKKLALTDPSYQTQGQLINSVNRIENTGIVDIENNVLLYIQALQNRWWHVSHPESTSQAEEKEATEKQYSDLCLIIQKFFGENLDRNRDGQTTLFGFPLGTSNLSDGQKVLLQFCVAVHAQASKLSELIVLMDEPENHLHPEALIDVISEIQKVLTHGQLWIATHSVPLLAEFDPDSIWWMEKGLVQHAGSKPELVLKSLIGDEERIQKLNDFLGLPAVLAANNFAHQCLLPPTVAVNGANDPQNQQIQNLLTNHRPSQVLKVLDFGAGRGRLISALRENATTAQDVINRMDYIAYDSINAYQPECEAAIARLYGKSSGRYFHEESQLRGALSAKSFDVVIMCNVLHEIDPYEWLGLFSESGILRHLLNPDGFFLVVEDMEMRIGEKAHQRGFLVLDRPHLRILFAIPAAEMEFKTDDARNNGRLKAHLIPARYLQNANTETLKETLKEIRHLSREEIKKLRSGASGYREGRKHAFHVQQLANADLALNNLGC